MVFDPGQVILVLGVEGLYLRALHILRGRGVSVPTWQIVLWHMGIALWVIGFFSPIHTLGDDLLSAHMAQHLLIADLAAPLLLAGLRNPVLMFYLPRPALVTLARSGWPRRAFRGHYSADEHRGMEVPGIYWHFVDVMWLVVYFTVYII